MPERHLTKDELRAEVRDNLAALQRLEDRGPQYNRLKRSERRFFWLLLLDLAAILLPEAGLAGRIAWRLLQRADRRLNPKGD